MTGKWKGTGAGSGLEYLAVRDGEKIVVHLMNTEPSPVNYRVNIARKFDNIEGWLTSPAVNMTATESTELSVNRQGESSAISGVLAANSLLTIMLKGGKAP
jgi:hypothetical protein